MVMASTAIYRLELSATFYEFDLEMSRRGFIGPRVLRPRMVGIQAADVGKIKLGVDATRRICDEQGVSTQGFHDSDRKCDLLQRVAFVVMEAAFHCHDWDAAQLSTNQTPGV